MSQPIWLKSLLQKIGFVCLLAGITFPLNAQQETKENLREAVKLEDLAYGNILFEYYRGNVIEALNAILVAQKRNALPNHKQSARLLSGVIYLDLGMLTHAQTIFNDLLTEEELKSELLAKLEFYLGKLHYRQNDYEQATFRLSRIVSVLEPALKDEAHIMLSNMAIARDQKQQAMQWLNQVTTDSPLSAFSRYNLGMLWLRDGDIAQAKPILDNLHPTYTEDKVIRSLQDKALLAMGYFYLSQKDHEKARAEFLKIRLSSPAANKALLGVGWSYLEKGSYRKALAHWVELSKRDIRDLAVQESLLAIPFAYQKLDSMQLSLESYVSASDVFQRQIELIDDLVNKIQQGDLIERFIDKVISAQTSIMDDSGIQDSTLLGDEYDYYLFELISQHRFNENFRSYQKLGKLAQILKHWEQQLPIFDEILKANEIRFASKVPMVEKYLAEGAFDEYERTLLALEDDIQALKANQKLYLLADKDELKVNARIERLMSKVESLPEGTLRPDQIEKAKRAKGVFQWQLETNKVAKIWRLEKLAKQIRAQLIEVSQRKNSLASARQAAKVRFQGFQQKVDDGTASLLGLRDKIESQIDVQAIELKSQIFEVLSQRKATLEHYLLQSDLSVARLHEKSVVIPEVD
ncbi:MAG: hypothetical protein OQK04_16265 [Kangiellaceae bacterium]|nr:hypothetical protein [Kangiellaceae bacterium]MCW9000264.1 hypothetical protein [Kangiellaceae bacterium]